ncbi:hypothetical protein L6272_06250, partial [Microgenomates group bacterium]|nr:hypothetical protein [Microgenomates group bacterium]
MLLGNEVRKVKSLGKEEYLNRSALKQAGEAMFKTTFKREGKETAVGKRGRSGGQTEDLVLTNTETAIAGAFGFGSSLAAIAILEDISLINFIPGMKAAKRLYLAPLLTMLISSGFGALGESYFDVFKRSDKVKDEKLFQQKKAQFVEMVLAVNAPVMQIMMTMGIATSLAEKAGEYVAAHPKAEVMSTPQPELTPTPVSPLEHIVPPVTTGTQPLEATPIPSAEMPVWHPGETVDNSLLQKAFGSGVNYDEIPINIDNDPESETVYRFNLDSDPLPEVWAVKDNQGVWQPWI